MANYQGVIIEESLQSKEVFEKIKIISTKVEKVTKKHQTPHLKKWTLHTVEVPESEAEKIVGELSKSLRGGTTHDNWYADFKNETYHFIIFPNQVFKIERTSKEQYDEAKRYGISLGIPEYQVDFSPDVIKWKR